MIVSFSIVPIGVGVELKEYIAKIIKLVDATEGGVLGGLWEMVASSYRTELNRNSLNRISIHSRISFLRVSLNPDLA